MNSGRGSKISSYTKMLENRIPKSFPDPKLGPMALPIVFRKDKNQHPSHEQLLLTSFSHMALISERAREGDWVGSWSLPYDLWRGGKFRKIVKRANPQRFDSLAEDPEAIHTVIDFSGTTMELLSFPPYSIGSPDPRVKPLQVSGLSYESTGEFSFDSRGHGVTMNRTSHSFSSTTLDTATTEAPSGNIVLAYNRALGASTGKMMAQAAHGAQILVQGTPGWTINDTPLEVADNFELLGVEWLLEVRDAGFTEIAGNSTPVKIGLRKFPGE